MKYTLCVDFDGTIVDHAFPEIGALKPGVREALTKLAERYVIVISSCRTSALFRKEKPEVAIPDQILPSARNFEAEMRKFLLDNEIPHDRIDMGDEGKVVALHYIDDRGVRFKDNWEHIAASILGGRHHEL